MPSPDHEKWSASKMENGPFRRSISEATLGIVLNASGAFVVSTRFEPSETSRLRRKPARGLHDKETVFRILDAGMVCHVGYVIDGQPFVTPTAYWREGDRLFWHGSAVSHMLGAQAQGMPVCVTVTHLDALVLARTGFSMSVRYRSVMAFGRTALIEDAGEKRRAAERFIDRLFPGRSRELRPIRDRELAAISIIAMTIEEASAKIAEGGVIEKEEEDYAFPVWAGIINVAMTVGKTVPDSRLVVGRSPPAGLAAFSENARLDEVLARHADYRGRKES
jgi:uncharacterized protein